MWCVFHPFSQKGSLVTDYVVLKVGMSVSQDTVSPPTTTIWVKSSLLLETTESWGTEDILWQERARAFSSHSLSPLMSYNDLTIKTLSNASYRPKTPLSDTID